MTASPAPQEPIAPIDADPMLLRAVAYLLRPLVRFLIAKGITYPTLGELLKRVYLRATREDFPLGDKRLTDSRISLLTGLYRKDVKRLREEPEEALETPRMVSWGSRLVALWLAQPEYCAADGEPSPLPRLSSQDAERSFESLAARVTRDISARGILDELVRNQIARIDEDDLVHLEIKAFVPEHNGEVVVGESQGVTGCRVSPPLDENGKGRSDEAFGKGTPLFRGDPAQPLRPLFFLLLGDLARQGGGRGAGTPRVGKDVQIGHRHLFHQTTGVLEGRDCFSGESYHDVDPDGDAGDGRANPPDEVPEKGPIVVATHRGEDGVIAALERYVKVAAEDTGGAEKGDEFIGDLPRFDRAQPETLDRAVLGATPDNPLQVRRGGKVAAVGAEVDPGEHDLAIPACGQGRDPGLHLPGREAPARPPGVGDDAVGTEGVAPVLDLQEGAGVLRKRRGPQSGKGTLSADVAHQNLFSLSGGEPLKELREVRLFGVPGDDADTGDPGDLLRGPLGVTAGDEDRGGRVSPDRPADQLPGLVIGPPGHRAGVDDVAVSLRLERDDRHPLGGHRLRDPRRFALVHLAPEGDHGDSNHSPVPSRFRTDP